ncbi:MAG: PLP-dependent aminotransferase family protein [Myxococcota bacterium]
MRTWDLAITLDGRADVPVFVQIARAVAEDIRRGRLKPGDRLPGSRTLAERLGVHRNTVLAAYDELHAEGWLTTHRASGTYVSDTLPDPSPRRFATTVRSRETMPARVGFDLPPLVETGASGAYPRGTLVMTGGVPDLRTVPVAELARAYRRVLRRHAREVLSYGDPRGIVRLRRALAEMVSSVRGLCATEESVVVTRGSQMALDAVARVLITPGDVVAVESFGYRPAWNALKHAGAELVPIPVDADGLRLDALRQLCTQRRVRAVYVTPHHQYPTTVVLSAGRRMELLTLAREKRIAIIEDDYDHEFHYDGRPVLPLASADVAGVVIYVGTLSKILAPGLRMGFVAAPTPLVERLAAVRTFIDRQGDQATESAVAELLEEGEVQRHARRVRRAYQSRRDALATALHRELGGVVEFQLPPGGMALWTRVNPDVDTDAWAERALGQGVAFFSGRRYAFDGRARPYVRLGFAALTENEIAEAVRRMRAALPTRAKSRSAA